MSSKLKCKYYRFQYDGNNLILVPAKDCKPCEHNVRVMDKETETDRDEPLQYAVALMGDGNQVKSVLIPCYGNDQKTIVDFVDAWSRKSANLSITKLQDMIDEGTARKVTLCEGHWFRVFARYLFNSDLDSQDYKSESVSAHCPSGNFI